MYTLVWNIDSNWSLIIIIIILTDLTFSEIMAYNYQVIPLCFLVEGLAAQLSDSLIKTRGDGVEVRLEFMIQY